MKTQMFTLIIGLCLSIQACAQPVPDKEKQISTAVMAAPEDMREGATVLGYDAKGELITLREGTNSQICVADDPNREGFQAVCYHKDLTPFMERGRALRAEGKNPKEIFDTREVEAKEGSLQMPEQPSTLHLLEGKEVSWNAEEGTLDGARYRYVVYIPFATAESTGLPTSPIVPGAPWIMDPGTHRAHIMITPPAVPEAE